MTPPQKDKAISWSLVTGEGAAGTGNWKHFPQDYLPRLYEAASDWKQQFAGIEKPWLCWCVDEDWCWYQQRLVAEIGWTPVVGTDGRFARPRLHPEAVFVEFNKPFGFPLMWMHFPVEFMYLFCERLAFWHSDVLVPVQQLRTVAEQFAGIPDGEVIAVDLTRVSVGTAWRRYRKGKRPFFRRYFEVVACTTAGASRDQFERGCSWWRHPERHPNFPSETFRRRPHYDHGVGIWLWKKYCGGKLRPVALDVHPYHYSTNHPLYRRERNADGRPVGSKQNEISRSFELEKIVAGLGLTAMNENLPTLQGDVGEE